MENNILIRDLVQYSPKIVKKEKNNFGQPKKINIKYGDIYVRPNELCELLYFVDFILSESDGENAIYRQQLDNPINNEFNKFLHQDLTGLMIEKTWNGNKIKECRISMEIFFIFQILIGSYSFNGLLRDFEFILDNGMKKEIKNQTESEYKKDDELALYLASVFKSINNSSTFYSFLENQLILVKKSIRHLYPDVVMNEEKATGFLQIVSRVKSSKSRQLVDSYYIIDSEFRKNSKSLSKLLKQITLQLFHFKISDDLLHSIEPDIEHYENIENTQLFKILNDHKNFDERNELFDKLHLRNNSIKLPTRYRLVAECFPEVFEISSKFQTYRY